MITAYLGNIGSGKTASAVRWLYHNNNKRTTYSNIITKRIKNNVVISPEMIIQKEVKSVKRTGQEVYDYKLNKEFWQEKSKEPLNVILDEAHTLFNPRRSMSKINIIMSDFLALLRRILGSSESGFGELIVITQLERRLDVILREMANNVKYHVCFYFKTCKKCGYSWKENNETSKQMWNCPKCNNHHIKKHNHTVRVWEFNNFDNYSLWKNSGMKTYFSSYIITDIEKYFPYYNTLQWDNLITDL